MAQHTVAVQAECSRSQRSTAPTYNVPQERIVSIEHPCLIKNFDNAFRSLGGEQQLKHVLEHKVGDSRILTNNKYNILPEPVAGVSLRPNDPPAKKLPSTGLSTNNVLLKVTVPKWTGRKRKRGSDDPFESDPISAPGAVCVKAPELLQRLRDNADTYSIEAVGMIPETHRFRGLPDFHIRSHEIPIMREIQQHATTPTYDTLQKLQVDLQPGLPRDTSFPAPPDMSNNDLPYQYEYQQADDIVGAVDANGNPFLKNTRLSLFHSRKMISIPPTAKQVPQGPSPDLEWLENRADVINRLRRMLDEQPVTTFRALYTKLRDVSPQWLREAAPWIGYTFSNGVWHDNIIKFGVDPRSDPIHRFTQTIRTRGEDVHGWKRKNRTDFSGDRRKTKAATRPRPEPNSHIFDGIHIAPDSKAWQVCDITDPMLHQLFQTSDIRHECDPYQWGWYHSGTICKARVVMQDKIKYLLQGEKPPESDYWVILGMPENMTTLDVRQTAFRGLERNEHIDEMREEIREMVKRVDKLAKRTVSVSVSATAGGVGTPVGIEASVDAGGSVGEDGQDLDDEFFDDEEDAEGELDDEVEASQQV